MRVVLENVLLFLLPTIVYCGIRYLKSEPRQGMMQVLNKAPLVVLFVCGLTLVAGLRIYSAATQEGGSPSQQYVPPHMRKDGTIEPGHMK